MVIIHRISSSNLEGTSSSTTSSTSSPPNPHKVAHSTTGTPKYSAFCSDFPVNKLLNDHVYELHERSLYTWIRKQ